MIMKFWIARDKAGGLRLFKNKPTYKLFWKDTFENSIGELDYRIFPEVTFENSPQEVEIKLVSENVGVAESPSKTFSRVNEFEIGASYRR